MLNLTNLESIGITHFLILDLCIYYIIVRFFIWIARPLIFTSPLANIPGPPSQSWFKGNLAQLFNAKGLPFHQSLVDDYGGMVKVYGFFGDEQLYVSDPKALQSIVIKDQDAYEETAVFIDSNRVVFGPGLVATTGEVHKRQRKLVMPLSDVLTRESVSQRHHASKSVLDMNEWMSRVALESVGQAVLNYSFDPLNSAANNRYTAAIKELITPGLQRSPTLFSLALLRQFAPFLSHIGSDAFRRKVVEWMPNGTIQKLKDISDVMHYTAVEILQERRENIRREDGKPDSEAKDIISVLLRENDRVPPEEKMSDKELTGQMTVLIFGAQDTTSSCLSRVLDLLAMNPDIQAKVRDEVQAATASQDPSISSPRLDYDEINALPWLDAVLKETLRLYPPVPFVRRTAVKERTLFYSVSDSSDLESDLTDTTASVTVPVGTTLFVSIAGANRLESLWGADAKEWKPTRWLTGGQKTNQPATRLPGIFAGTLSFLGGGRSCPGYKFALIEMKIILATLLMRFKFSKTDDEIVWNLSQIISPSVRREFREDHGVVIEEAKGLPLVVEPAWNQ
ncbi:hypothetical protein VNI00_006819 [Paramarasmius palmivorus]|uniref:Cytochrome P450 n=1 Tax=Paramarasmius palmivorus TaxID=297713 RepID=A0AAW0D6Z2_9AGAR